jgi:hypothetical protein
MYTRGLASTIDRPASLPVTISAPERLCTLNFSLMRSARMSATMKPRLCRVVA